MERWGDELWRAGFRPVSLAGSPAAQARLLLGMYPWKGYTLVEEDAASVSCVSCSFVATLLFLALSPVRRLLVSNLCL